MTYSVRNVEKRETYYFKADSPVAAAEKAARLLSKGRGSSVRIESGMGFLRLVIDDDVYYIGVRGVAVYGKRYLHK